MKKKSARVAVVLLFSFLAVLPFLAQAGTVSYADPKEAVESFCKSVAAGRYDVAWQVFSRRTQERIIMLVAKDEKLEPSAVKNLFDTNNEQIQAGFWKSFRESSKMDDIVNTGTFQLLQKGASDAVVELHYNNAKIPLKSVKEGDFWKMAWVETFPM